MSKKDQFQNLDQLRSEGDLNLSPERLKWRDAHLDQETRSWLSRDEAVYIHQSLSTPCLDVIQKAESSQIQNLQGKSYFDFHGNSVHQVGFGHPKIIEAVKQQLDDLPFCPRRFTNIPAILFAEKLAELAPNGLNRVLLAPSGASAVGIALKLARHVSGKFKTISMWDSFHGASLDTISLSGEAIFRKNAGPLLPGAEHVPPPNPTNCPFKCGDRCNLQCADYVDYVLEKEGDVAAVVSETVSSVPFFPPKDYWKRIRASCNRHDALLILDEIPHSLGRVGTLFTFERYGIIPDMVVLGKGLGGGVFPLAAVIARDEFNSVQELALGHYTHEKNPVACAAGLAVLEILVEEKLPQNADKLGRHALDKLKNTVGGNKFIREIRGLGLLIGIELNSGQDNSSKVAEQILYECLRNGLSFKISMGNVLTLAPPLNISHDYLDVALDILTTSIENQTKR